MPTRSQNSLANDHYLNARELFRGLTPEGVASAKGGFSEAIGLDPEFARAYGWLAYAHLEQVQEGWTSDVDQSLESATELALKGVELAPDDYYTHWNLATIYLGRKNFDLAQQEFEKALALNPTEADLHADMADMYSYKGQPDKAIEHMELAFKLRIPQWYHWSLGFAYFQKRQYEQAVAALEKMRDPPNTAYLLLMACKAKLGNPTTAEAIMERLLSKDAAWRPDHLNRFPFAIEEDQEHYLKSLKAANVPEPAK